MLENETNGYVPIKLE
jgi:hypothetical protein